MKTIKLGCTIVFLVSAFLVTSHMSFQDGLDEQVFRCKMIAEETYPNVDGYFEKVCKS